MKHLITITGPSGSGKSELLNKLLASGKFAKLLSVTTRQPREGEKDGVDYRFTTDSIFNRLLEEDQFVQTVKFRDKQYGTLKTDAEEAVSSGVVPVCIVEPSGIFQFQKFSAANGYTLLTIFVQASFDVLVHRYLSRLAPSDFESAERIEYHSKRIAGIHDEHSTWGDAVRYNCTFINSGNDLNYIEEMAKMIELYVENKSER
jgi:guanylate kinase